MTTEGRGEARGDGSGEIFAEPDDRSGRLRPKLVRRFVAGDGDAGETHRFFGGKRSIFLEVGQSLREKIWRKIKELSCLLDLRSMDGGGHLLIPFSSWGLE